MPQSLADANCSSADSNTAKKEHKTFECKVNFPAGKVPLGGFCSQKKNDEELKFHNSIPCTTPQSLADAHCSSAMQ